MTVSESKTVTAHEIFNIIYILPYSVVNDQKKLIDLSKESLSPFDKRKTEFAWYIHLLANHLWGILSKEGEYIEYFDEWRWVELWVHQDYLGEYIYDDTIYLEDSRNLLFSVNNDRVYWIEYSAFFDEKRKYFGVFFVQGVPFINLCYVNNESIIETAEKKHLKCEEIETKEILDFIRRNSEEAMLWRDISGSKYFYFLLEMMYTCDPVCRNGYVLEYVKQGRKKYD